MRIRVSLISGTAEASACVHQATEHVSLELKALETSAPPFSLIDALQIHLTIAHPCAGEGGGRGKGSYVAALRTFAARAALTYEPWMSSDWAARMAGLGEAMQRALAAVHKTRITEDERKMAGEIVQAAIEAAARKPPRPLIKLKPIYLGYSSDEERPMISFGSPLPDDPSLRVVVVPPAEAMAYVYLREDQAAAQLEMFKLYKRSEAGLEYWEAWPTEGGVIEHRGLCGDAGSHRELPAASTAEKEKALKRIKAEARKAGFRSIPKSRHAGLLVEADIDGFGSRLNLETRRALEDFLDHLTGWLGLGHCDGGSTGSGTMEAFCLVVDYDIAAKAIEAALATSAFAGFRVRRE